jgi:hypothetical protein
MLAAYCSTVALQRTLNPRHCLGRAGEPMIVEGTQLSAGKPATSHELMRLEDREAIGPHEAAAPNPPGETEPPSPSTKDVKTGDVKTGGEGNAERQPPPSQQGGAKSEPKGGPTTEPRAASTPPTPRPLSQAKVKMQERLPALADDAETGQEKEQTVPRDGKADLGFAGKLLGSAASTAPKGQWQEFRIYSTSTGKHVFSKVTRSIFADENDKYEAEVFDPTPTSVPSQLLRSAREMARSRPMTWMDAAVAFFGYDPLAKVLYRKLSVDFEERV